MRKGSPNSYFFYNLFIINNLLSFLTARGNFHVDSYKEDDQFDAQLMTNR